jgi:hypothetical protein
MEYDSKAKYAYFRIWPAARITPLQSRRMLSEVMRGFLAAANSMFAKAATEVLLRKRKESELSI